MKYDSVYLSVLNNLNYSKIEQLEPKQNCCFIFLSDLDFSKLELKDFNCIRKYMNGNEKILIPTVENYLMINKWKREKDFTLFADWLVKLPISSTTLTKNSALLYVVNQNETRWHDKYAGDKGYGVNVNYNQNGITYHPYSAGIGNTTENLEFFIFDGFYLRPANI